jgi:hypothetical protein
MDVKTSEYIENVLGIKLLDVQKDFCDYLDENPDAKIVIPRMRSHMMDISVLYLLVNILCKGEIKW